MSDSNLPGAVGTEECSPEPIRPPLELQSATLQAACPQCWAYANRECVILPVRDSGPYPLHFPRYEIAKRLGHITPEELAAAKQHIGTRQYVIWPGVEYTTY